MKPPRPKLSYANVVSSLALFAALGGVSYAAVALPAGSVGHKQVRASAITTQQVRDHTLRKRDFRAGVLTSGVQGPQGEPGPQGERGPQGPAGDPAAALTPGSVGTPQLAQDSVTYSKLGIVPVHASSNDNTQSPKLVQVDCPSGTTILSGGAGIAHNFVPAPGVAALSYNTGLPFQNGWAAEAYSTTTGSSWELDVIALCIKN
jgi:hypothetical protein